MTNAYSAERPVHLGSTEGEHFFVDDWRSMALKSRGDGPSLDIVSWEIRHQAVPHRVPLTNGLTAGVWASRPIQCQRPGLFCHEVREGGTQNTADDAHFRLASSRFLAGASGDIVVHQVSARLLPRGGCCTTPSKFPFWQQVDVISNAMLEERYKKFKTLLLADGTPTHEVRHALRRAQGLRVLGIGNSQRDLNMNSSNRNGSFTAPTKIR